MSDLGPGPVGMPGQGNGPVSENSRLLAGFGYIVWVVALVALLIDPYKSEPFVRFHAVQALALTVVMYFAWVPVIGWLLGIVALVFLVIAAINAFQGRRYDVPVLADLLRGWFDV